MKTFIEKQHQKRPSPKKHSCDLFSKKPEYSVTNDDLRKMAANNEADANNIHIFNGKQISDNKKAPNFYALKAHTPYQSPLLYFGHNDRKPEPQVP